MPIELESRDAFDKHMRTHGTLHNVVVQGVDLVDASHVLASCSAHGAVFIGCALAQEALSPLLAGGATILPAAGNVNLIVSAQTGARFLVVCFCR
jgi:hypothetical protein